MALISSRLYRALPGYEDRGAVCVSAFLVVDESDARGLLRDVVWEHYGLSTAGAVRSVGYEVVGTDIEEDGQLIPFSDRHVDVVAAPYPMDIAPYDDLSRSDRRALRENLAPEYQRALRLFDPRRGAGDEGIR